MIVVFPEKVMNIKIKIMPWQYTILTVLTHLSILKNSLFNTTLVWKIPTWEFHSLYLVSTPIHYLESALSNTSVICKFNPCKINLTNVWVRFSSSLFPEYFVQLIPPCKWIYRKTLTASNVWHYTHSMSQHIPWNTEKVNWLFRKFSSFIKHTDSLSSSKKCSIQTLTPLHWISQVKGHIIKTYSILPSH
jgi:hypothetical protein